MESWRKFMNEAKNSSDKYHKKFHPDYGTEKRPPSAGDPTFGQKPAPTRPDHKEVKYLPDNFMYRADGVVVHRDNGEEVNTTRDIEISKYMKKRLEKKNKGNEQQFKYDEYGNFVPVDIPPGDFEYDDAGNLVLSDTVEAGPEDQLDASGKEFMSRFDLP